MDARELRLAENEVLFREVNEQIERGAVGAGVDGHLYEFVCECSNLDCTLRLRMTIDQYEDGRKDPTTFFVAPGHDFPEIEEVVYLSGEYQIVKKLGDAAAFVASRDRHG